MALFNEDIKFKIESALTGIGGELRKFIGDNYASCRITFPGDMWAEVLIETSRGRTYEDENGNTILETKIVSKINWPACGAQELENFTAFQCALCEAGVLLHRLNAVLPKTVSEIVYTREENVRRKAEKTARVMQAEVENVLRRLELKNMRLDKSKSFDVQRGAVPVGVYNVTIGNKAYSVTVADEVWEVTRIG